MSFTSFNGRPLHTREEIARTVHAVSLGRGLDELADRTVADRLAEMEWLATELRGQLDELRAMQLGPVGNGQSGDGDGAPTKAAATKSVAAKKVPGKRAAAKKSPAKKVAVEM